MKNPTLERLRKMVGVKITPYLHRSRKILKIAGELSTKMPVKGDSIWGVGMKILGLTSIVIESANVRSEQELYFEEHELLYDVSSVIADVIMNTRLRDEFRIVEKKFGGDCWIEIQSEELGRAMFARRGENSTSFYASYVRSRDFDGAKILRKMWDLHGGRIQGEVFGMQGIRFSAFEPVDNPLYGPDEKKMEKLVRRHRRYQLDRISRFYMFYGKPGTGKTSFAHAFADRVSERVLRISAESFNFMSVGDLHFMIQSLEPQFLLIDDFDKIDTKRSLSNILMMMQDLKADSSKTSMILTANEVQKFDKGLLRPGRIDSWFCFDPPDEEARGAIFIGYAKASGLCLDPNALRELVRATEGMTQDYVREFGQRMKYEELEEILETASEMRKLLDLAELEVSPTNGAANGKSVAWMASEKFNSSE